MNRKVLAETTQIYEKKIADLTKQLEDEHASSRRFKEQSYMMEKKIAELMMQVEDKCMQSESAEKKLVVMRMKISDLMTRMDDERCRSESAKEQIIILQKLLSDNQTSTEVKLQNCNYYILILNIMCYIFSVIHFHSVSSFVLLIKFVDACSFFCITRQKYVNNWDAV